MRSKERIEKMQYALSQIQRHCEFTIESWELSPRNPDLYERDIRAILEMAKKGLEL